MNLTGGEVFDKYQWKLRILLVTTPSYQNDRYLETKKIFEKNKKEFHKRYLKMVTRKGEKFGIELIGFDGGVKERYRKLDPKRVIKDIEAMPMGDLVRPTNLSLYEDYDKTETMKGLGYKDREKALETLEKIKNRPFKYQMSVVNTMIGRAENHPHQTKEMMEAVKVFKRWKTEQSGGTTFNPDREIKYKYQKYKAKYLALKKLSER